MPHLWLLLPILILMLISFFVSGTEMAFASTPVFKWESAFKDNPQSKCYKVVKQMVKHFTYTNMMCLIIDTIVNLIISELFTLMLHPVLNESWMTAATFGLAFLMLFFFECFPKIIAKAHPIVWIKVLWIPCYISWIICWPLSWLINKTFSHWTKHQNYTNTEQELNEALSIASKEHVIESDEVQLAKNALRFDDKTVEQVMTKTIADIDWTNNKETLLNRWTIDCYSRWPVKKDGIYVGYVMIKEVMTKFVNNENYDWHQSIQAIHQVSSNMKLDEVFRAMQKTHDHIMLVVDSANQVIGIITNEELLEEITGEIFDETD